jgi:hypothetical protein
MDDVRFLINEFLEAGPDFSDAGNEATSTLESVLDALRLEEQRLAGVLTESDRGDIKRLREIIANLLGSFLRKVQS